MRIIYNITSKHLKRGKYVKFFIAQDTTNVLEKLEEERNKRLSSSTFKSTLIYIPKFENRPDLPVKNIYRYCCLLSNTILLGDIEIQFFEHTISYNSSNYEHNLYDAIITFDAGQSLASVENNFDQLKTFTLKI